MRILAIATAILMVMGISGGYAFAAHSGPAAEFHLEAFFGSSNAFDFEVPEYVLSDDPDADVRLGLYPSEVSREFYGYKRVVALNGATIAYVGDHVIAGYEAYFPRGTETIDYEDVGCSDFDTAAFSTFVEPPLLGAGLVLPGSVLLVETAAGSRVKLLNDLIDFSNPNGLGFDYEILDCSSGGSRADMLSGSGIPGNGIATAPGLQRPFNEQSKAADHAGMK